MRRKASEMTDLYGIMLINILLFSVAMLILFVSMEKPRICPELKGEAYN